MQVIRKKIVVQSENIKIPELTHFIGKKMDVLCIEDTEALKSRYHDFFELAGKIDIDEDAISNLRNQSQL